MSLLPTAKHKLLNWYFEQLQLIPSPDPEQFLNDLTKKYGENTVDELIEILEARGDGRGDELYDYKNQTLALSLDFAQYSADLYAKYLKWFIEKDWTVPERILDIGCDNGIVTCFYALLYPNSEIVGIDICNNAICSASRLAERMQLANIKFITGDMTNPDILENESFDMITSLRSAQEIFDYFPISPYYPVNRSDGYSNRISIFAPRRFQKTSIIERLLKNKQSIFVTCERLATIDQCTFWAEILKQSGLFINWSECGKITFHELGEIQEMPILTASKIRSEMGTQDGIYNLYTRDANITFEIGKEYAGPLAQVSFATITDKEFLMGMQVIDSDNVQIHYELWRNPNMILKYQYSNNGYRELRVLPKNVDSARQSLAIVAAINHDKQVKYYKSLKERKLLFLIQDS